MVITHTNTKPNIQILFKLSGLHHCDDTYNYDNTANIKSLRSREMKTGVLDDNNFEQLKNLNKYTNLIPSSQPVYVTILVTILILSELTSSPSTSPKNLLFFYEFREKKKLINLLKFGYYYKGTLETIPKYIQKHHINDPEHE